MEWPGVRRLRDLSLYAKVTLTLSVVLATVVGLFLLVLASFQREQRQRLLDQEKRLVATLTDARQRSFIYDLVGQNRDALTADLADLARQPRILWTRIQAPGVDLRATADPEAIRQATGESSGPGQPVLVLGPDHRARVVGAAGQTLAESREPLASEIPLGAGAGPGWPEARSGGPFREIEWRGESVLHCTVELLAAGESYGRLQLVYSLAAIREGEARTRTIVYAMVGTAFAVLLVLLNLLVSRLVIAPLRRAVVAMSETSRPLKPGAGGSPGVRLPVQSRDEIGTMAATFNRMAAEIETSRREIEEYSRNLEAMVAERTRALRESEERLMLARNHLATVIAHVATGVVSLDADGRVTTFNDRAAEILGVAPGDAIGRPLDELCGSG